MGLEPLLGIVHTPY